MFADVRPAAICSVTILLASLIFCGRTAGDEPPKSDPTRGKPELRVGPETEKRFPPLVVPAGFKATLFACDPLVEYPSVIALGPRANTLFVAHDYVTGLGVDIVRRDEIRVVADTNGDGYADRSTLFAKGFNSIQGLAYHDGAVLVMHAPLLTSLRDTDGDDAADERRDLIAGLGLPPEENDNRLHCANGVVAGYDGWLYLALGDRGCDVLRPEGDRLLFQQGGILRCRPNGTGLHVFSTGLRNIYDVALDEDLNVFVRDNENDGGDFMIRVCHCFFGSDHGYPYHYYEHPSELLPPLADLGRGSSAGVTTYLETAFPQEFRESLFGCEWGRAVVRYRLNPADSGFGPTTEIDFAAGAPNDPYGFKPTDLVVDRDGSLLISDWCDGQRPQRGRARIYRISYQSAETKAVDDANEPPASTPTTPPPSTPATIDDWIARLDSPGHHERLAAQLAIEAAGEEGSAALMRAIKQRDVQTIGRLHAVWILAHVRGAAAIDDLFSLARIDEDIRVRVQAIRAIADLTDPVLAQGKLDAGRGDARIAQRLAALRVERDPRLLREVIIALGRLKWTDAPRWIFYHLNTKPDVAVQHAAAYTLRAADNWASVFTILENGFSPARPAALVAAAEQYNIELVDGLLARGYAGLLCRVYKKPGPYEYWGFRPAPRPVNSVDWERTDAIGTKMIEAFAKRHNGSAELRKQILREGVPIPLATLTQCLIDETDENRLAVVFDALRSQTDKSIASHFAGVVRSAGPTDKSRLTALEYLIEDLDETNESILFELAKSFDGGEVLAAVIAQLGARPKLDCNDFLLAKLESTSGAAKAAVIRVLADRKHGVAVQKIIEYLDDPDVRVCQAAAYAAGQFNAQQAVNRLLLLAGADDVETRRLCLEALRELGNAGGVPAAVEALKHPVTQLAALSYLARFGDPRQQSDLMALAESSRSIDVLAGVVQALSNWEQNEENDPRPLREAISQIQGDSGLALRWTTFGPMSQEAAGELVDKLLDSATGADAINAIGAEVTNRRTTLAGGTAARIVFDKGVNDVPAPVFVAVTFVQTAADERVEFSGSSNGDLRVWLNAKAVFERKDAKFHPYQPDTDKYEAVLSLGTNRLVARIDGAAEPPQMHLRFRRKSSQAEHERLTQLALAGRGDEARGRELFFNAEKSQCIKCHRLGSKGGKSGRTCPASAAVFRRSI